MTEKLVTKNDLMILTLISMIMIIAWYWIDHVEKNKSPYYGCKTDSLELKMSDDRTAVELIFEDGGNVTTPVLHTYFAGTGECETATYIFSHNDETYGLSNLGCGPKEMFESGAKGNLYVGQWSGAKEDQFDWTGYMVEPPAIIKECF
jgi:hypothetical protein